MITPLNPYIAGNPVGGGEAFIGRSDVLRNVLRVLKNPNENGIVLYGQRRIGKTSVLLELALNLTEEGDFTPVYFDLQDKAAWSLEEVLHHLANEILYTLDIPKFENQEEDFITGFKQDFLPYILSQLPEENALVLLFDEFDVLDNPKEKQAVSAFFPYLRDLMSLDAKRLKFIFVIGRRPEDLSSLTLSVFKGVKSHHVSLLSKEDTTELIHLSKRNNSLEWSEKATEQVYQLTGGHPYLTQQLCQVLWEDLYDDDPDEIPIVEPQAIEQATPDALKNSTNALEWLWDGLKPAQRIVSSALAEAGTGIISQERLEQCLQESGVRILVGELQNAPKILAEWDLIRSEEEGYRMPVEMLRRWIVEKKPLSRVQDEIDRILPAADHLFQAAYGFYQIGQFEDATPLLQQTVRLNPNHLKANQLLAEILLAQDNLIEAREILETLYEYNPSAARPRLIQVLLGQAKEETQENEQLILYSRILELEADHPEATIECKRLWEKQGDEAYKNDDLELALEVYKKAGIVDKIEKVEKKSQLSHFYLQALDALEKNNIEKSQELLIEVLAIDPKFGEATRYMHLAVTGIDTGKLQNHVESLEKENLKVQNDNLHLQNKVEDLNREKVRLEAEIKRLQNQIKTKKRSFFSFGKKRDDNTNEAIPFEEDKEKVLELEFPDEDMGDQLYALILSQYSQEYQDDLVQLIQDIGQVSEERARRLLKVPSLIQRDVTAQQATTAIEQFSQIQAQVKLITMEQLNQLQKKQQEAQSSQKPAFSFQPSTATASSNEKYALILRKFYPDQQKQVLELLSSLSGTPVTQLQQTLKTPTLVLRDASKDEVTMIAKQFRAIQAETKMLSMSELQKLMTKK